MPLIINGEKLHPLWLINKAQVDLYAEKLTVQRTVEMLDLRQLIELPRYGSKHLFTIGEVAKEANI